MPHHSRGRLVSHRRAGIGADRVGLAGEESHRPGPGLLASHFDWHRSGELRVGLPAHHRSNPFAPALGAIGGIRTCLRAATHGPHRATVNDGTRPINFAVARQPAQKRKCIRSQTASCCQSRRRRQQVIPDPQPSSFGNICHGIPLRSTTRMPVTPARSGTGGRPPFGRGGEGGRSGSNEIPHCVRQQHGGQKPPTLVRFGGGRLNRLVLSFVTPSLRTAFVPA